MTSGGLGPTDDDRTKEAVAAVLGRPLVRDEEILLRLKERFRKRGYEMPEVNAKQADVIEGATVLANRRGSAPGFLVEQGGKTVVLLPGVPHELKAMWDDAVAPLLARAAGRRPPPAHPEGGRDAGERRRDAGQARLRGVSGRARSRSSRRPARCSSTSRRGARRTRPRAVLDRIEAGFQKALAGEIFGRDDETLEGVVGDLLRLRQKTLALAESCTGGLLAGRLTDVAGSSDYFLGSAVTYANAAKADLVGVVCRRRSSASAPSPRRPPARWRSGRGVRFGAAIGLSVTGIAGPGGGTPEKPVGTVHLALDDVGRDAPAPQAPDAGGPRAGPPLDHVGGALDAAPSPPRDDGMAPVTRELLALAAAYLLGSVPFAIVLVRLFKGVDVRTQGSGNAGATNVLRTAGKGLAVGTMLLDVGKGVAAVLIMRAVTYDPRWLGAAAVAAVLGHVFPVWFSFRGGKGVATAIGGFGVLAPWAVLAVVGAFVLVVAATRFVSLGSITAACLLPLAMRLLFHAPDAEVVAAAAATLLLVFSHRANIQRLLDGTERRLGRRDS